MNVGCVVYMCLGIHTCECWMCDVDVYVCVVWLIPVLENGRLVRPLNGARMVGL